MSLPARQRRMLDGIEVALRASEPHMTSMFAIFTRLAQNDLAALPERLPRFRFRMSAGLRAFVLLPALFAMLITGVVLGGTARGSSCGGVRITGFALNRVSPGVHDRAACGQPLRPAARLSPAKPAGTTSGASGSVKSSSVKSSGVKSGLTVTWPSLLVRPG